MAVTRLGVTRNLFSGNKPHSIVYTGCSGPNLEVGIESIAKLENYLWDMTSLRRCYEGGSTDMLCVPLYTLTGTHLII